MRGLVAVILLEAIVLTLVTIPVLPVTLIKASTLCLLYVGILVLLYGFFDRTSKNKIGDEAVMP